ncbi:hypothetical protein [Bacteroides nordii]|uniref:hypothetical protein n=1 Tax=Bacteroides nordii TaxID=291645 RepID=UPI00189AC910|nr:hypothetical protein [Bacteroides nordii]
MGKKKNHSIAKAYSEMKEGKISKEEFQEALANLEEMLKSFPYPEYKDFPEKMISLATRKPKQKKKKN